MPSQPTRWTLVRKAAAGGRAECDVVPFVAQGFQGMADMVPEADQAWTRVRRFVEETVPPG